MKQPRKHDLASRSEIEELLVPGGGTSYYAKVSHTDSKNRSQRWSAYALLSSIRAAVCKNMGNQVRSRGQTHNMAVNADRNVTKPGK